MLTKLLREEVVAKAPKGEKRDVEVAVALWIDLLGYGSMLELALWDPTSADAKRAMERIQVFQATVTQHSMRNFPSFVMNDGAIAFRDLSPRSTVVSFDFLRRAIALFDAVNFADVALGCPGARAVLATGFRVRRFVDSGNRLNAGEGANIKEKLKLKKISQDQAINHALMARHHCDSTPELQHNYAMTKAYLVESSGKAAGISGSRLYVDMALFKDGVPSWIVSQGPVVHWNGRGMGASFTPIGTIDIPAGARDHDQTMRDAYGVASILSANPAIEKILRAGKVGNLRSSGKKASDYAT